MLTTTDTIPFKIIKIVGLVKGSGSAAGVFSNNHEEVDNATDNAIADMSNKAKSVNANAIKLMFEISLDNRKRRKIVKWSRAKILSVFQAEIIV